MLKQLLIVIIIIAIVKAREVLISRELENQTFSPESTKKEAWNVYKTHTCYLDSPYYEYRGSDVMGIFANDNHEVKRLYENLPPHYSVSV